MEALQHGSTIANALGMTGGASVIFGVAFVVLRWLMRAEKLRTRDTDDKLKGSDELRDIIKQRDAEIERMKEDKRLQGERLGAKIDTAEQKAERYWGLFEKAREANANLISEQGRLEERMLSMSKQVELLTTTNEQLINTVERLESEMHKLRDAVNGSA